MFTVIDLVHELVQNVVTGELFHRLAVEEQHGFALAAGNADVGLPGLTGAVDPQPITATLMDFL